jgi:hypothetical protein
LDLSGSEQGPRAGSVNMVVNLHFPHKERVSRLAERRRASEELLNAAELGTCPTCKYLLYSIHLKPTSSSWKLKCYPHFLLMLLYHWGLEPHSQVKQLVNNSYDKGMDCHGRNFVFLISALNR